MNNPIPFCIAGMHRSGTSLVAGWMHNSGVFLGNSLLESASSNPKGHFEDEEVLEFHSRILEKEGFHRSGLTITKSDFQLDGEARDWIKSFSDERKALSVWAWKEPRSTLFLESWKEIIPELKVIGIYRKPELVVESLYKRLKKNKWYYTRNPLKRMHWFFDIDLGKSKWKRKFSKTYALYNQELLNFQKKHPEDTLLFEISDIISKPLEFHKSVNSLLKTNIELIPFENFYTESLLTKSEEISPEGIDSIALEAYKNLKKSSSINV